MAWIEYKYNPKLYQLGIHEAFDAGVKRIVQVWHRRAGKDLTDFNLILAEALQNVGSYYYFFPKFNQGKRDIWEAIDNEGTKFLDYIPPGVLDGKPNDTELKLKFKNGSIIQIIGTDNYDSILGSNPKGCVFSEYQKQKPEVWDYIRPILAANGGWAIFNFTPRGRNHAWKILQIAKDNPDTWEWQILTVDDTKVLPQEVLDQERKEMPEDTFRQEYYCEFLENAGAVFKNVDQCVDDKPLTVTQDKVFQMGVDLAKYQDFSVITPLDLTEFQVGKPERFNLIDYNVQKAKIEAAYYHYNKARTYIDSTGVGEPVFDDLQSKGLGNIYPYHFTEETRKNLLTNLQILIEQRKIKLPNDPVLLSELKSFHYELTHTGKVRMAVPEGLHDDCVMSLALACWDLPNNPIKVKSREEKELLKQYDYFAKANKKQFTGSRYLRRWYLV